ncbi:CRISPR-associated endonuclease Cas2 [Fervidobacterium nodosum]|uniref:CRISPR-associated endoribonuclease Cas2 n=1 Tax=Fervidobacterium nodosum (strain ATCC 35602 / DSM 5306 / Rt17-B1) TaxID=381764 RepID=A7HMV9_FERNB|nr:CRISPR-associated endonuclease Cas2 [Fervidobacterium nodosum]ABS61242.1 CRISPR-associated protein Cas2 [Fervidobacterium nodosum Rt17-B1]
MSRRILLVYDVNEKRVAKVHRLLLRYLVWRQNSTFEGKLTNGAIKEMIRKISRYIKPEENDGVAIYYLSSKDSVTVEILGTDKGNKFSNFIE